MAGMGPPPKHPSQRRRLRDTAGLTQLPAEGRKGKPPKWPLPGKMLANEMQAWRDVWSTPQAVQWARLGWTRTVARYVRAMVQAERPEASAAERGEVRQLEDRLGLSPMSMLRLRWEIVADELAEQRAERSESTTSRQPRGSSRERLKVVDPQAVGER